MRLYSAIGQQSGTPNVRVVPAKKKQPKEAASVRLTSPLVDPDTAELLFTTQAKLRAQGIGASISALVEVALLELLQRRDLVAVLKRHDVKLRRD